MGKYPRVSINNQHKPNHQSKVTGESTVRLRGRQPGAASVAGGSLQRGDPEHVTQRRPQGRESADVTRDTERLGHRAPCTGPTLPPSGAGPCHHPGALEPTAGAPPTPLGLLPGPQPPPCEGSTGSPPRASRGDSLSAAAFLCPLDALLANTPSEVASANKKSQHPNLCLSLSGA